MYEIRKAGAQYRIYDKDHKRYVGHTNSKNRAEELVSNTLINFGFQGAIPSYFYSDVDKYGLNFDRKMLSD